MICSRPLPRGREQFLKRGNVGALVDISDGLGCLIRLVGGQYLFVYLIVQIGGAADNDVNVRIVAAGLHLLGVDSILNF